MSTTGTSADSARRKSLSPKKRKRYGEIESNKLWWSAFVAGSLLVVGAAWVPVPYFYIVGLVFPLVVMGIYAYLGWKHTLRLDQRLQFADSVYYLGFLFTLVTLALALIYLGTSADWERVPLEELIGRFGLALATTIIGLAIRVAWVNASKERPGARDDAEQALAMAAEEFRVQLEQSSEAFKSLGGTYIEELQKAALTSSQTFEEHANSSGKTLAEALDTVSQAVDGSAEAYTAKFRDRMSNFALPDEWLKDAISGPIEKISNLLDLACGKLETSIESQKRLATNSDKVAETFRHISESLEPLASISDKVGGIANVFDRVSISLTQIVKSFEAQLSSSEQRMNQLSDSVSRLDKAISSLAAGMTSASASSQSLIQIAEVAKRHRADLETSLAASRQAVTSLHDELVMAAKSISAKLGGE